LFSWFLIGTILQHNWTLSILLVHSLARSVNLKESTSHDSECWLVELQRLLHFPKDNKDLNMQEILWFQVPKFLHLMESPSSLFLLQANKEVPIGCSPYHAKYLVATFLLTQQFLDFSLILSLAGVVVASKVGEFFLYENLTTITNSCRSHQLENNSWKPHHTTETKINPCKIESNHNYKDEFAH